MNESIKIILKQFKDGNLSEDETIILIENIYGSRYIPIYTPSYPLTPTWKPNWEVTCTKPSYSVTK